MYEACSQTTSSLIANLVEPWLTFRSSCKHMHSGHFSRSGKVNRMV